MKSALIFKYIANSGLLLIKRLAKIPSGNTPVFEINKNLVHFSSDEATGSPILLFIEKVTYRREVNWFPDRDLRRAGGEPPLLAGWPWYHDAVGLSDEDNDTESATEANMRWKFNN